MMPNYVICECRKYAHVLRISMLRSLEKQAGELCPDCNLFMVPIEKIVAAEKREQNERNQAPSA